VDDEISDLFPLFGGPIYPQSILIDKNGVVVYSRLGLFEEEIIELIESNLGVSSVVDKQENELEFPRHFELGLPYPNPFNPSVQLTISLSEAQTLEVEVYNMRGQLIKSFEPRQYSKGLHTVGWEPESIASGTYIIRVHNEVNQQIRRVALLR